jgi:selenophosphate synthase
MENSILKAVRKHYEANIEKAKVNIEIYLTNPSGIGEHSKVVEEVVLLFEEYDKNLSILDSINRFTLELNDEREKEGDRISDSIRTISFDGLNNNTTSTLKK